MIRVNGIPLDNAELGWVFRSGSTPYSSMKVELSQVQVAGRDGTIPTSSTVGAPLWPLQVNTPPSGWEALQALFRAPVLTLTRDDRPGVEVTARLATSSVDEVFARNEFIDVTYVVELVGAYWRDKLDSTVSVPMSSASVVATAFASAPFAGQVSAARNLFTNPDFETAAGSVEVRRNGCTNARPVTGATVGWSSSSGAAVTSEGYSTTPAQLTTPYIFSAPHAAGMTLGRVYAFRAKVTGTRLSGAASATQILVRPHKNAGNVYYSPGVTVPADGTVQEVAFLWTSTVDAPASDGFNLSAVGNAQNEAGTFRLSMTDVLIEDLGTLSPPAVPPFFHPADPTPDTDLTPAFAGAANASEIVLTGVRAVGVNTSVPVGAWVVQSSQWGLDGSKSVRVAPAGTIAFTYGSVTVAGLTAGGTYTAVALLRLPEVQSGTLDYRARSLMAQSAGMAPNNVLSNQAPNVPGVHELRVTFTLGAATSASLFLINGSSTVSTWFERITVVPGVYSGPPFSGRTANTPERTYLWDAVADASTSSTWLRSQINGGISAPVSDAVIRVKGAATGIQVTDSSGAWVTLPNVSASQWVRFEAATGRCYLTTSDVWTGGTDVSGQVDFGGPRGVFEITPVMTPGDPSSRSGKLTVATATRSGAVIEVRGKAAYAL